MILLKNKRMTSGERKASPHPCNVNGAYRRWWCVSDGWTQTETPHTRHRVSPSLHRICRCLFLEPSRRFRAELTLVFSFPFTITPTRWGPRRQDPPPGSADIGQSPCSIVRANRTWPATTTSSPRIDPTMNPTAAVVLRSSYSG